MNIGLFLVGDKGYNVLKSVYNKTDLKFVLSYNDKNTKDISFEQTKLFCEDCNIPFYNAKNVSDEVYESVDKIFVIGWQFLLNKYLDKLIIIHDSRLPDYKGWAPTVNALIEGDLYLAATAFKPTDEMDTGDIYLQNSIGIEYPMKISKAIELVSNLYVDMILEICKNDDPKTYPMTGEESFCIWRDREDYYIDWKQSAYRIQRFVDAVGHPFDGAKIKVGENELTIHNSESIYKSVTNSKSHAGKLFSIKDGIATVVCGEYMLKLTDVRDVKGNPYLFKKLKIRL